jgi:hypothetical protein
MIAEWGYYTGRHDKHIIESGGEIPDNLVMYTLNESPESLLTLSELPRAQQPLEGRTT